MGIFGAVTALAAVVGPVLGGAITQGIAWQWIFWVNVPIGLLLQAAGFAWIAAVASPQVAYLALLAPMILSGTGIAVALPALTKTVVGSVPAGDIGKASGVCSTMRQLSGAFGVAIPAAVFASAGS
jgi:MFS family permease